MARPLLAWPGRRRLVALLVLAGLLLLPLFARDFALARRVYGVAASVHARLEVPVLLLALAWSSGTATGADHAVVAPVLVSAASS